MNNKELDISRVIKTDVYDFFTNLNRILKLKIKFKNATIQWPLEITYSNINNIYISDGVRIYPGFILRILNDSKLYIGKNTSIGAYSHIAAVKNNIIIGKEVLIADKVFISTTNYQYENININIREQGHISKGDVIIGDECWIGINVSILSGVKIGKHTIIGANSVVTKNIPSYSVAAGNPANIIKKYNFKKNQWIKVNKL